MIRHALSALGELKSEGSILVIEEAYKANEIREDGYGESIRIYAVNALGDIGSEKSVEMLNEELSKERDVSFGYYIVEALGKIGSEKSLTNLEEYKTYLEKQLADLPEEVGGEWKYIWEQANKQVGKVIVKIGGEK